MLLDSPPARLLVGGAYTMAMCQRAMLEKALGRDDERVRQLVKQWAVGLRTRLRIEIRAEGFDAVDFSKPYVIMANHQSYLDVLALFDSLPTAFGVVAKKELFAVPFFSGVMRAIGCVPVDRSNRAGAITSLRDAAAEVAGGRTIAVFPEGTRSRGDRIQPLKSGSFHLARLAKVAVLPVGIRGSHSLMPLENSGIRSGVIRVQCGTPVDPPSSPGNALKSCVHTVRTELGRLAQVPLVD